MATEFTFGDYRDGHEDDEPDEFTAAVIEALTKPVEFLPAEWSCGCVCHSPRTCCALHLRPCCDRTGQFPR